MVNNISYPMFISNHNDAFVPMRFFKNNLILLGNNKLLLNEL